MSSIVTNQRLAFLARAIDDARRLEASLANLSDAQRAGVLAIVAAKTSTPVDISFIGEPGDWREAHQAVQGYLRTTSDHRWELGSGCHFQVEEMPR